MSCASIFPLVGVCFFHILLDKFLGLFIDMSNQGRFFQKWIDKSQGKSGIKRHDRKERLKIDNQADFETNDPLVLKAGGAVGDSFLQDTKKGRNALSNARRIRQKFGSS